MTTVGALVGTAIGIGISEKADHVLNSEADDFGAAPDFQESTETGHTVSESRPPGNGRKGDLK